MPFPEKLLNDDEEVVLDLRPHWLQLFWPTAAFVVAVAATIWINPAVDVTAALYVCLAVYLVTLLWLIGRYLRWTTTEFVVTSQRLVYRYGVPGVPATRTRASGTRATVHSGMPRRWSTDQPISTGAVLL